MNDIEVIRLVWHQYDTYGSGDAYLERHKAILEPVNATFGGSQEEFDRETMQPSYDAHLEQLGLLTPHYNVDRKTGHIQIGTDGDFEIRNHSLCSFGRLLLRQLGILESDEE